MRISLLPSDDNANGWSRILPPREPKPSLSGDVRADWVVVGAGYAGLAAARRLAENRPDDTIVIVDAGEVGEGASGRNSGFAIDVPHVVGGTDEELGQSMRYMTLARTAIAYLQAQVERHGIACDWNRRGKYQAAVSELGVREVLKPFARELEKLGEPFRWVEGEQLARDLGTSHFLAAVFTPGCILMNPAALCRGLGDSLPANATLYEQTPVTEIDHSNGIRLTTPEGSIVAPQMIMAVNGFAEKFGYFKDRLMPFAANASLSRPLTGQERAALGCIDNWGMTPANAFAGITMRFTGDHRILVRQNITYCPGLRQADEMRRKAKRRHKQLFDQRFPMLPEVEMEHTWTGFVCLSRNGSPGFGRVAPNVHAAVCQNAVGVTRGTVAGMLCADMACGVDNPLIAELERFGTPDKLPPQPLRGIGIAVRLQWELWRARSER